MKTEPLMQSRRRFLRGTGATVAASIAFPAILRAAGAPKFNIRLATIAFEGTSFHQTIRLLGDDWQKLSGGDVKLTVFAGGSMGDEVDAIRKIRANRLQAGMLTSVGLAEIDRSISALQLMPMMFRTWAEVDHVREKLRPQLEKAFSDKGFVMLFWADAGWVRYFCRKKILTPAEMKPMKVWSMAGDSEGAEVLKDYYRPVQLSAKDILTSLDTGMVDVVPIVPVLADAGQFVSATKHMLDLKWVPVVGATVVQKKLWDAIPADLRSKLAAAAEKRGAEVRERSRKEDETAIVAMQKRGLQVHAVTPEAQAAWEQTARSAYPKIRGRLVPEDLFDQVERLLKEFRASQGA